MVAANVILYHPSVDHYLKFVATTVGRDKLIRTVQYFSRFYAWYLFRTNEPPSKVAPYDAIKKQLGLARKLLRIGKNIEHFKAAYIASDSKNLDSVIRFCAIGRQLGYAGYLSFDAATYLDAAGIKKNSAMQRLQREAYKCWMCGLLFSTASGMYSLYTLKQQEGRIDKKNGESVVARRRIERERAAINLQLISDLCDLMIPTSAIGLLSFDDGLVGLAGTVSSLIGVYVQWKKTA
ncbi:Peroxisomal membrane protein PMP30A [Golovinomyces cichoracearum]|uniref:Peroxisomal membrane protein PMP30A n=1 Tax=Golovinomyces cichoracearum TaxID=62708 RepID=A0A420IVE1_9PEZI|nr:Peroxisomal membrane protein PMP30A [Golovinomyces cichoracearum]